MLTSGDGRFMKRSTTDDHFLSRQNHRTRSSPLNRRRLNIQSDDLVTIRPWLIIIWVAAPLDADYVGPGQPVLAPEK